MKKNLTILIFSFFITLNTFSQNKIWCYDGAIIDFIEVKVDSTDYVWYKNMNGKYKSIYKSDIFEIIENGKEKYLYEIEENACPTENKFDELGVEIENDSCQFNTFQMKDFIQGRFDGKNTKAPIYFTTGLIVGTTFPLLFPVIGLNTAFSPVVPAIYDLSLGMVKVKTENLDIPQTYKNNIYYKEGFKMSVKKKRLNKTIVGSAIGVGVGLIGSYVIFEALK